MKNYRHDYQSLAHQYAYAGKQDRAKCETGGNNRMFFENDICYSYGYHFAMSRKIRNKDGETVFILWNPGSYSVTTNKQQSALRSAFYQRRISVHSFDIDGRLNDKKVWKMEGETVQEKIYALALKYQRARKDHTRNEYLCIIQSLIQDYIYLANYFKFRSTLNTFWRKVQDLSETELLEYIGIKAENLEAKKEAARKRREADRAKKEAATVQKWRNYEINNFYSNSEYTILRMLPSGNGVQTSQGITIEIKEAKRLLRLIDLNKAIGDRVNGQYKILKSNGVFQAGCHLIKRDEIEKLRPQIKAILNRI